MDRAALDAALKHGVDCDGWCPTGRRDEVGKIPARYPVKELASGGFGERTLENVKDSDATIIIFFAQLREGTEFTSLIEAQCFNRIQSRGKVRRNQRSD